MKLVDLAAELVELHVRPDVALALVPEAVAFPFVAGVSPLIGLYSAIIICLLITAVIGGRPGKKSSMRRSGEESADLARRCAMSR